MNYNYTAYYKTEEERIKAIEEDILREYPNLGNLAREAASLEKPFGRVHEDYDQFSNDENHINRLIDIVIVTEEKPEFQTEYNKAVADLLLYYDNWQRNFSYANPEEQSVNLVMDTFKKHKNNKEVPLITVRQADVEIAKILREKDIKNKADILRDQFPELGTIADEVIKYEYDNGIWLRWIENDIVRLVDIIKLVENRKDCTNIYLKALEQLKEKYSKWSQNEINGYVSPQQKIVIEMMNRFTEHLKDKNIPISTYAEIKAEEHLQKGQTR